MRKGVFKTYARKKYNDGNIKGTIDIERHIAKNTPFIGNISYSQREHSYDNDLMELIRHTIEFIKKKPYGTRLLLKVKDEVNVVVNVTQGYEPYDKWKIIKANQKNIKLVVEQGKYTEFYLIEPGCGKSISIYL